MRKSIVISKCSVVQCFTKNVSAIQNRDGVEKFATIGTADAARGRFFFYLIFSSKYKRSSPRAEKKRKK